MNRAFFLAFLISFTSAYSVVGQFKCIQQAANKFGEIAYYEFRNDQIYTFEEISEEMGSKYPYNNIFGHGTPDSAWKGDQEIGLRDHKTYVDLFQIYFNCYSITGEDIPTSCTAANGCKITENGFCSYASSLSCAGINSDENVVDKETLCKAQDNCVWYENECSPPVKGNESCSTIKKDYECGQSTFCVWDSVAKVCKYRQCKGIPQTKCKYAEKNNSNASRCKWGNEECVTIEICARFNQRECYSHPGDCKWNNGNCEIDSSRRSFEIEDNEENNGEYRENEENVEYKRNDKRDIEGCEWSINPTTEAVILTCSGYDPKKLIFEKVSPDSSSNTDSPNSTGTISIGFALLTVVLIFALF